MIVLKVPMIVIWHEIESFSLQIEPVIFRLSAPTNLIIKNTMTGNDSRSTHTLDVWLHLLAMSICTPPNVKILAVAPQATWATYTFQLARKGRFSNNEIELDKWISTEAAQKVHPENLLTFLCDIKKMMALVLHDRKPYSILLSFIYNRGYESCYRF